MSLEHTRNEHRYRVGIVGLSWITSEPARPGTHPVLGTAAPHSHLSSLAEIPSVQVVAGCDISPAACDNFRNTWSATWPDLRTYDDFRAMVDDNNLDIVCVATPDHLHGEVVRYCASNGVKGIFCEKPIAVSVQDADSTIASIDAAGSIVNVNNTRRWVPQYVAAREAIRSGAIGSLVQINIHFGGERAMLWRNHSHFLDLFSYFAESEPQWVIGELGKDMHNYGETYRGDGGRSPELEPGINAYIAYQNGVRGYLSGMKTGIARASTRLIGSDGIIDVDDQGGTILKSTALGWSQTALSPDSTVRSIQAAILDLIHAMETDTEPQSPPHEARKTVTLIEGILKSHHAGNIRIDLN